MIYGATAEECFAPTLYCTRRRPTARRFPKFFGHASPAHEQGLRTSFGGGSVRYSLDDSRRKNKSEKQKGRESCQRSEAGWYCAVAHALRYSEGRAPPYACAPILTVPNPSSPTPVQFGLS